MDSHDPDALLTRKVGHFLGLHGNGAVAVVTWQGACVRDQEDDAGIVLVPAQGFDGIVDAGKAVLVEAVGGDFGLAHLCKAAFEFLAVRGSHKVADHSGDVFKLWHSGCAVAEGHKGKAYVLCQLFLLQAVVDGLYELAGLLDIGLHGNSGVHDNGNTGARSLLGGWVRGCATLPLMIL